MFYHIVAKLHLLLFFPLFLLGNGECRTFFEDTSCGYLYSDDNFTGSSFAMTDFDQSVNLAKDYRVAIEGWRQTGSIQVLPNCTMHICSISYFEGTCHRLGSGNYTFFQILNPIHSVNCSCTNKVTAQGTNPTLIRLPENVADLAVLTVQYKNSAIHPGIQAAMTSAENGRSFRNAYIVLIGGNQAAPLELPTYRSRYLDTIGESHFSVNMSHLGIHNAQLRVITVALADIGETVNDESRWIASLDNYLSTNEELKNGIPNAVVVYHFPFNDSTINERNSWFQRKLRALKAISGRIVDPHYSNVIHLLCCIGGNEFLEYRNTEAHLNKLERVIDELVLLPKPTVIIPRKYHYNQDKVNGHWKMSNEEYYPRNLQHSLMLASEKGGDALGRAIFQASYSDDNNLILVSDRSISLVPGNDKNAIQYRDYLQQLSSSRINNNDHNTSYFVQNKTRHSLQQPPSTVLESNCNCISKHFEKVNETLTVYGAEIAALNDKLQGVTTREGRDSSNALKITLVKLAEMEDKFAALTEKVTKLESEMAETQDDDDENCWSYFKRQ